MFLVMLNQNKFLFSISSLFLMMWAGQPVTHMRSANSKPQPSNQPINSSQTQSSHAHI